MTTQRPGKLAGMAAVVDRLSRLGRRRLSLTGATSLEHGPSGIELRSALGSMPLGIATVGAREAGAAVAAGDRTLDQLVELLSAQGGQPAVTTLYLLLGRLAGLRLIEQSVIDDRGTLASTMLWTDAPSLPEGEALPERVMLSRFAVLQRDGDRLILDSPLAPGAVTLHDARAVSFVTTLVTARSISQPADDLDQGSATDLLELLWDAGTLTGEASGVPVEDRDPTRRLWDATDLRMHAGSRFGRHDGSFGAAFRHIGEIGPLPAVRPLPAGRIVDLPAVDLERVRADDRPFTDVLEGRTSERPEPAPELSLTDLGEFLYRTTRVRWVDETDVANVAGHTGTMEVTSRPYPSGGRSYELEVYVSIDRCVDLESGLYFHDPAEHRLVLVRPRDELVERLLGYASIAAPGSEPAAVLHLAARFGRVTWKYDAIAYATTLKHVGVMYQSMYLVATAMGLAPCALGSGDSDAFARAAGTDYLAESSVGDFMLSGRPRGTRS